NKDLKRADVGLILSKKFGYVGVVGTITGSPAAKANFTTGDMIESIGGVGTRDMPLAYASMLLRGENGTSVELSVVRTRHPEPAPVNLTRAVFALPAVESRMLADKVGYINIDALSPELVKQVAGAVQQLQKDGAQKLMLDLRNCAAGTPEDGIALANLFLNKGRIAYLVGQKVARQNFEADPAKAITTLPVAVLTNRGTADAAEVAAAALMDNKRAQVVGERTYGDAALRRAITMEDGGAIILSVAKYYSPEGKAIQDTGVTPNNVVSDADAQIDLLPIAEHVLVGRHTAPALIDPGPHTSVGGLLPVGHLVFLVETFEPGTYFLFVAIRVVAHRALLEYGFALGGIAFARGQYHLGTGGQADTSRKETKAVHIQKILQRSI